MLSPHILSITYSVRYPGANHITRLKDRNYMIISVDAEKAFDRIQHTFIIKDLENVGLERI